LIAYPNNQKNKTMKRIKRLIILTLLTLNFGVVFSQSVDSLNVFPNPFASSTTIHFDIVQSDLITLQVLNLHGQIVRTFFQSTILPSGSYNINFIGDSLVDGIYFIRLEIGSNKTLVKKVAKDGLTSSFANKQLIDKILIYPNPSNDKVTIPIIGSKSIIISDMNGKILKSFSTEEQIISLLDLSAGQYFITISTNQNKTITTQKILKLE